METEYFPTGPMFVREQPSRPAGTPPGLVLLVPGDPGLELGVWVGSLFFPFLSASQPWFSLPCVLVQTIAFLTPLSLIFLAKFLKKADTTDSKQACLGK